MAEFLSDLLAYGAPGFFQGFQAANQYRRQKAMDEFQMKMREDEIALRRAAEERLAQQARQQAELHAAQMESYRAAAEEKRVKDMMGPIDPQDPLVNDLSMGARVRAIQAVKGMKDASRVAPPAPEGLVGPPEPSPYDQLMGQYESAGRDIQGIAEEEVRRRDRIAQQLADARMASATRPPAGPRPRDMRPTPKQGGDVANLDLAVQMLDKIAAEKKASGISTGITTGLRTSGVARVTGIGLDRKALAMKSDVEQQLNAMVLRLAGTTFSDRYLDRLRAQMANIWESDAAFDTKVSAMKEILSYWRASLVQGVEYSGRDTSAMGTSTPGATMSVEEALTEFADSEVR